jgi:hypothetical protein
MGKGREQEMNLSTQQRIRALIASLSEIPNHLDDIAREERPSSTRAADDLCRSAELIRHALGRLEMAIRTGDQAGAPGLVGLNALPSALPRTRA